MKVYIVKCDSGRWDSYREWVAGIFDDQELANQCVSNLITTANGVKEKSPIYPEYEDYVDDMETYHILYDMYYDYFWKNEDQMEFNNAVVCEYDLNVEYDLNKWRTIK